MPTSQIIIRDEAMRSRVAQHIAGLNIDKPWRVTIALYRPSPRRTLSQNAMMWVWINDVVKHVQKYTGQDADTIHQFFKGKFLLPPIIEFNGEMVTGDRTTTKLSVDEMSEYMHQIEAWVTTELGILLPKPEDLWAA